MASLEQRIRDKATELGFVACGFARADAAPEAGDRLREWIAAGHHGEMGWIEDRAEQRASPAGLWPDAKSVVALAMSYAPATDPRALAGIGVGFQSMPRAPTITRWSRKRSRRWAVGSPTAKAAS